MSRKQDTGKLAISVKNVGVAYQRRAGFFRKEKFWALKDVSFDVFHGETLGVIGGNGAGKSTLLRLLAGIISPDKGQVINHGVSVTMLSLQVGFVKHLTGRENSILSGMMLGFQKIKSWLRWIIFAPTQISETLLINPFMGILQECGQDLVSR